MTTLSYLDVEDVLTAGRNATGGPVEVRDFGLLASAVTRQATTTFGQDAYPDLYTKAAALLHSLARNYALADGNKRTAWAAARVFLEINGRRLREPLDEEAAEQLMVTIARGELDVPEIAPALEKFSA